MDLKKLFSQASQNFDHLVKRVKLGDLAKPTPDTEWSVRDLLNHVTGEQLWIPELLAGKTIAQVGSKYDGDILGQDVQAAWAQARRRAAEAVNTLADLKQIVHLSFGDLTASDYIEQSIIDLVIHGWDLAIGIGGTGTIDVALAEAAYGLLEPQADAWRQAGIFGPRVDVPPSAEAQAKLLALSGRRSKLMDQPKA